MVVGTSSSPLQNYHHNVLLCHKWQPIRDFVWSYGCSFERFGSMKVLCLGQKRVLVKCNVLCKVENLYNGGKEGVLEKNKHFVQLFRES